ncbi:MULTISPECIES: AbfB domain-containing protein [unclassified Streptomyces]|uniref:AbfB domain-containing protein n=1 Tax=unclassified Streptomyces TaxID=2593676 RepID=UPI000ADC014D|nr:MULTISPECIES: AbfB domain-containing protein [unclassified Streptomyces]
MYRENSSPGTRRAVTRAVVGTTAMAAVLAMSAETTASALPAPPHRAARAVGIGTTETQRVDAAAVVRLDPTPDVLLLSDYDFVHALWQRADAAGEKLDAVRTAAEKAMASTLEADQVAFIVTGVHEAHRLDQQRERDKAELERAARLARQQTLQVIGIPSTPELLALSDDNFIRAVLRHEASGPEVRAAATRALVADEAARREFIVNGAREAHGKDVAKELEELEEKNRQEAERRRNQAARKNVAALFRVPVAPGLLDMSDDNFIREMLRVAPADLRSSELYLAAQKAVLSSKASDWLDFLYTGADAAYKRDDAARREKLAQANRMLAREILDAARKSPFTPHLVTSAEKALAAGDLQIAEFLSEDGQRRARRQSLQMRVQNSPEKWLVVSHSGVAGGAVTVGPAPSPQNVPLRHSSTWLVVPSLSGQAGCYSFEAAAKPGHYLKATTSQGLIVLGANNNTKAFKDTTSWCPDLMGYVPGKPAAAWFSWFGADRYQVKVNARNELFTGGRYTEWRDLLQGYPAWEVIPPYAS